MALRKQEIIRALEVFIRQRPGLEFGNYRGSTHAESVSNYRAELRQIAKDLQHAKQLLRAVELSSIPAAALLEAFPEAYSGRLSIKDTDEGAELDYCTGQYWPTEYRKAVAAVCAHALWEHYRDGFVRGYRASGKPDGISDGDIIRAEFKRMFGSSIQKRFFN